MPGIDPVWYLWNMLHERYLMTITIRCLGCSLHLLSRKAKISDQEPRSFCRKSFKSSNEVDCKECLNYVVDIDNTYMSIVVRATHLPISSGVLLPHDYLRISLLHSFQFHELLKLSPIRAVSALIRSVRLRPAAVMADLRRRHAVQLVLMRPAENRLRDVRVCMAWQISSFSLMRIIYLCLFMERSLK